jgi:hypothetical protein
MTNIAREEHDPAIIETYSPAPVRTTPPASEGQP